MRCVHNRVYFTDYTPALNATSGVRSWDGRTISSTSLAFKANATTAHLRVFLDIYAFEATATRDERPAQFLHAYSFFVRIDRASRHECEREHYADRLDRVGTVGRDGDAGRTGDEDSVVTGVGRSATGRACCKTSSA